MDGVEFVIFDVAANINGVMPRLCSPNCPLFSIKALTSHCIVRMNSMFGSIHKVSQGGLWPSVWQRDQIVVSRIPVHEHLNIGGPRIYEIRCEI